LVDENPVACSISIYSILGEGREKLRREKKAPDSTKKQKVGRERVSAEGPGGFVEEGTNRHIHTNLTIKHSKHKQLLIGSKL